MKQLNETGRLFLFVLFNFKQRISHALKFILYKHSHTSSPWMIANVFSESRVKFSLRYAFKNKRTHRALSGRGLLSVRVSVIQFFLVHIQAKTNTLLWLWVLGSRLYKAGVCAFVKGYTPAESKRHKGQENSFLIGPYVTSGLEKYASQTTSTTTN